MSIKGTDGPRDEGDFNRLYDERYARYGKRFEPEHNGEFLAISPQGETFLAPTAAEVMNHLEPFDKPTYVYKVGAPAAFRFVTPRINPRSRA